LRTDENIMTNRLLVAILTTTLVAPLPGVSPVAGAAAQEAAQPSAALPPQQRARNIQLDLTIADSQGGKPISKTVSMLLSADTRSVLRSSGQVPVAWPDGSTQFMPVTLNLDAGARMMGGQLINVTATFEFGTAGAGSGTQSENASSGNLSSSLTQRIDVNVSNGRPVVVSKSADPISDRTVTVELTATIREP